MGGWDLERQVRFVAGLIVLAGLALGRWVDARWLGVSAFAGLGLTFSGLTDICAMRSFLARMPWNKRG